MRFFSPNIEKLARKGKIRGLICCLSRKDEDSKRLAREALIKMNDPRVVDELSSILMTHNVQLQVEAVGILGSIGSPRAINVLVEAIRMRSSPIRGRAMKALGNISNPGAVNDLIRIAKGKSEEEALAAIEALGNLGDPQALEPITTKLQSACHEFQIAAARALGFLRDPRAIQPLVLAWVTDSERDNKVGLHKIADKALHQINPHWEAQAEARGAVLPLLGLLQHQDETVRQRATEMLVKLTTFDDLEIVLATARHADWHVRWSIVRILLHVGGGRVVQPLFDMACADSNPDVRELAFDALGQMKYADVGQAILNLLCEKDRDFRRTAAKILAQLKDPPFVENFLPFMSDRDPEIRRLILEWLAKTGDASCTDAFIVALTDDDPAVRATAAKALGQQRDQRVIDPLITALGTDDDPDVRANAASALGQQSDQRAIDPLITALVDEKVLWAAIRALENIGAPAGLALRDAQVAGRLQNAKRLDRPCIERVAKMINRSGGVMCCQLCLDSTDFGWIIGEGRDVFPEISSVSRSSARELIDGWMIWQRCIMRSGDDLVFADTKFYCPACNGKVQQWVRAFSDRIAALFRQSPYPKAELDEIGSELYRLGGEDLQWMVVGCAYRTGKGRELEHCFGFG